MNKRIPICLVTGFLGSGKTSFLRHIAAEQREQRLAYIVNEFSSFDIDGDVISHDAENVKAIPGGSIFCRCLVTEFIGTLSRLSEDFGELDGVVIEASGMADPSVTGQMLEETKLDKVYGPLRVISIVDPNSYHKLSAVLPGIVKQVEAAGVVLVNKIDICTEAQVESTVASVRNLNPAAEIMTCSNGRIMPDLFGGGDRAGAAGEYAKCRDPNYASMVLEDLPPIEPETLRGVLEEMRDDIYRVKGYIPTSQGSLRVDYDAAGFHSVAVEDAVVIPKYALIFIVRGDSRDAVRERLRQFGRVTGNG